MALIKNGAVIEDRYEDVSDLEKIPSDGLLMVGLAQWQANTEKLAGRDIAIKLKSDEAPDAISESLSNFNVIALEFPAFRDGRAYSYARILREQYGYGGEIRAVGDVLMEQLHFMIRVGFDAFEIQSDDPVAAYETALEDFSVWYQPTGDGRKTAVQMRWNRE